jgi:hypothetical protein
MKMVTWFLHTKLFDRREEGKPNKKIMGKKTNEEIQKAKVALTKDS